MKSSSLHHAWILIESTMLNDDTQSRSAMYINNNLITVSQITSLTFLFSDITAIKLIIEDIKSHLIINIYNSCDKSLIDELHEYLRNNINIHDYNIIIMKDNFNIHHFI